MLEEMGERFGGGNPGEPLFHFTRAVRGVVTGHESGLSKR